MEDRPQRRRWSTTVTSQSSLRERGMEMSATKAVLRVEDGPLEAALYVSFELADKSWKLTCGDGRRNPGRFTVAAGDQAAVLERIERAKARCALPATTPVHSCYEAGRDGWWLHRWLRECGIDNIVVDSSSIEVNRHARRAKSDRLDGDKLLQMLLRHRRGERVWSVLREPSAQVEDDRRVHRELQRLTNEHTAHSNRIRALLVLHNLRTAVVGGKNWSAWWAVQQERVPLRLRAEIQREDQRLELVRKQLHELQALQRQELAQQPQVQQLSRLRAIGLRSAWVLSKELFGWRQFDNRRQVAGCLGLAPTPYASGDSQREQGISKAGNKRVRWLLVELSWRWLRLQPLSEMTLWFNRRFATGSKRMRRIGIVALARRLAVALWRYVQHGEVPAGATLKLSPV
jgi:transposase